MQATDMTYSNCGAVLADTALHQNHVEVVVASKSCTNKTEGDWQHLELNSNHWQLYAHRHTHT